MTPTNEDILATAKIICAAMTGPSDFGWYDQSDQYRAKCMDAALRVIVAERQAIRADCLEAQEALLREAMCGLSVLLHVYDGVPMNPIEAERRATEARAILAKLREHLEDSHAK